VVRHCGSCKPVLDGRRTAHDRAPGLEAWLYPAEIWSKRNLKPHKIDEGTPAPVQDFEPVHNMVYMNVSSSGEWASFSRWVTIHPEPWAEESDPVELLQSNMLFPTLEALCEALPELTQRIDPSTGERMQDHVQAEQEQTRPANKADHSAPAAPLHTVTQGQGDARAVTQGQGDARAVLFTKPRGWMGDYADKDLYQLLPYNNYMLSTAIAATASRYGGELPALIRIMIVHNHIRPWMEELTAREMSTASPLDILQVDRRPPPCTVCCRMSRIQLIQSALHPTPQFQSTNHTHTHTTPGTCCRRSSRNPWCCGWSLPKCLAAPSSRAPWGRSSIISSTRARPSISTRSGTPRTCPSPPVRDS
jgi:hypothetical protein